MLGYPRKRPKSTAAQTAVAAHVVITLLISEVNKVSESLQEVFFLAFANCGITYTVIKQSNFRAGNFTHDVHHAGRDEDVVC